MIETTQVIKYPISTEKVIRLLENENKMAFIVDRRASKQDIKKAVEEMYKIVVAKVTTTITPQGKKKAYVKFAPDQNALDVATDLGMM